VSFNVVNNTLTTMAISLQEGMDLEKGLNSAHS